MAANKVYSVGPDEVGSDEKLVQAFGDFEWLAYHYEAGDYEGDGELVFYRDGELFSANLSHCSCYGPLQEGMMGDSPREYSKYVSDDDATTGSEYPALAQKIIELMGKRNV